MHLRPGPSCTPELQRVPDAMCTDISRAKPRRDLHRVLQPTPESNLRLVREELYRHASERAAPRWRRMRLRVDCPEVIRGSRASACKQRAQLLAAPRP